MNETSALVLSGVAGLSLGGIFFGGLWWTVRKGMSSRRPALLFIGSFVLRTSIVLIGIYQIGHESGPQTWQRLLLYLLGFVVARFIITWLSRRPDATTAEARHAP